MGIAKEAYRLLLEEKKRGVLKGESILQLGRQCILFDYNTLTKYSAVHEVPLVHVTPQLSFSPHCKELHYIDDLTLFKSLGFNNIKSIDISSIENADIIFDLNEPIPEKYWGMFDVIYDGGTLEHVFNFPQALKNIHLLLKDGGIVIHLSPSHNHVDHGYYMFSPQVFSEYYGVNRYSILTSQIFEYSPNYKRPWKFYDYRPGSLHDLNYGGFGNAMLAIYLVAQKKEGSTAGVAPQQGSYDSSWHAYARRGKKEKSFVRRKLNRLAVSLHKRFGSRLPGRFRNYLAKKKLQKVLI